MRGSILAGFGFAVGSLYGAGTMLWYQNRTSQNTGPASETDERSTRGDAILRYGAPKGSPDASCYKNHVLHYDQMRKIPVWVAEHITEDHLTGSANRRHAKFKPDPSVPKPFSSENKDYWKSGWSRGHMAPAGDNKFDQVAMDESFYLSNVLPQDLDNNAGFWNRMEIYCRDLTKKYKSVRVLSGPVMLSNFEEDGKRFIKHQVIGENDVHVPTHLYKVILVEDSGGRPSAMSAFIVPNEPISNSRVLKDYQIPLHELERKIGFELHPQLDRTNVDDLCKVDGCQMMSMKDFELYFTKRKLESATTAGRVEKVWKELSEKGLQPTSELTALYERKQAEVKQGELK